MRDLVRVVHINPLKIDYYWPLFEYGLRWSSQPGVVVSERYINNMLAGCLIGGLQCWLCYTVEGTVYRPVGTVITRIDKSEDRGVDNLVIENLYGFGGVPGEVWTTGMEVLMDYAVQQGCRYVIATTHSARVIEVSQAIECKSIYSILEWEVK